MQTLVKVSEADWALAKRRERVLSTLVESKECSRAMIQKACAALQLSRAMVFRLLARYRKDRRLSALLLHPRGRKCGSGGLREEQEQIIAAQIRKIGGKKRSVGCRSRVRQRALAKCNSSDSTGIQSARRLLGSHSKFQTSINELSCVAEVTFSALMARKRTGIVCLEPDKGS